MAVGMMDPAYFVGKKVLVDWLNKFYKLNYVKVEDCASGAAYCQIADSIFPGDVPMSKVNFSAKLEHEFVANYKVLQAVFTKHGVQRYVDVPKLIKAKYQDNLEFLQWMKAFFDSKYSGADYDAVARRKNSKGGKEVTLAGAESAGDDAPSAPAPVKKAAAPSAKPAAVAAAPAKAPVKKIAPGPATAAKKAVADDSEVLREDIAALNEEKKGLEKERDFYFGKLRQIEILCQTDNSVDAATKAQILEILYHIDDTESFQAPTDADVIAPVTED